MIDGNLFGADQPCFGCGPNHPQGFRLRFEREGDEVVTRFTPGPFHQGPPGIMHGGLVATLADEVGAWTVVLLREKFGFTAEVAGKLLRPVRVGAEVVGRGRVIRETRRVLRVGVDLVQAGAPAFAGELAFVLLDRGAAERMLGGPIPDAWLPFCR
ncbi:MAG TPA: PaaI family thioesterase [Haliangiales bacterium]|nr:PaaI family thioesterase [Haliangiales bacterium]